MNDINEIEFRLMELDERLALIARRPVDIANPQWVSQLKNKPSPLDEAGVRELSNDFLTEVMNWYEQVGADTRRAVRQLFNRYPSVAWALGWSLTFPPDSTENFRRHLILFAVVDQGRDTRDAIVELNSLCQRASSASVKVSPVLTAVSELSSDENKYGMGSTRKLLLQRAEAYLIP